ncbi:hypothetical protein KI387_033045, partial [Taxus chinensis]
MNCSRGIMDIFTNGHDVVNVVTGDVAMGKDICTSDEDVKVGVSGYVDMKDIGVFGIDREVGSIRKFGD